MSRSIPREFRGLAQDLPQHLSAVLGGSFVGLYVYGSLPDESFVSGESDMDCIAVTAEPLDDASLARLRIRLDEVAESEPSLNRVQMSLLMRERVLEDDPSACLYQFGRLSRSGSDGNPIIWLDFYQRGIILHGPDPRSFVPNIDPETLHQALVREVGYLRDEISQKPESEWRDRPSYRGYAILTLGRILYTHATGKVISKSAAADWARATQPLWAAQLVATAEGSRQQAWITDLDIPSVERLIDYTATVLRDTPGSTSISA